MSSVLLVPDRTLAAAFWKSHSCLMVFWGQTSWETITVVHSAGNKSMDELLLVFRGHTTLDCGCIFKMIEGDCIDMVGQREISVYENATISDSLRQTDSDSESLFWPYLVEEKCGSSNYLFALNVDTQRLLSCIDLVRKTYTSVYHLHN